MLAHDGGDPSSPARGPAEELAAALYRHRLAAGLSQRALASRLGLRGHGNIADYEKGRRLPPGDLITAYERVFGVAGGELRRLRWLALGHRADVAVRQRAAMTPASWAGPPSQLPPPVADFVDRARELALLRNWIGATVSGQRPSTMVISGLPGVGKSALALQFAWSVRGEFPDVQLDRTRHASSTAGRQSSTPVNGTASCQFRAMTLRANTLTANRSGVYPRSGAASEP